jgi:F-type H+-transporting ATPase subunit b
MELLEINLTSLVMLLQFVLMAFFLYKLLYKPYLNMTSERQNKIKEELGKAEKIKEQAVEMKKEAEAQLAKAQGQAEGIIDNAHKAVDAYTREEKTKAKEQAERNLKSATEEIETMKKEAVEDLKREAVSLAVLMASKIIEKKLDEKAQREFLYKMLNEAGRDDYS